VSDRRGQEDRLSAVSNSSGTLATAGGLTFLALADGTVAAYDDVTLDELCR
jgi:hypothetical protein